MGHLGRKHECGGCHATYFDLNKAGLACPRCGKPPAPNVGPVVRTPLKPPLHLPRGMLDRIIDDGSELLGEDSLEGAPLKTSGVTPPVDLLDPVQDL